MKIAAFAATLLLVSCGGIEAALSPTLLVSWRATGEVHGDTFDASGEIACIPVEIGTELTSLGHEAFPRWTLIPLATGRMLALDVSAACFTTSLTQDDILLRGHVFEDAPHPRWAENITSNDWRVRLEQTHRQIASADDRRRVVRAAQELMQGADIFCIACHSSETPDPFIRIVRKDLSQSALPAEFFDRWGDASTGSCRRSRPIPIPGVIAEAGLEEQHLAACTRLRREDPAASDRWPSDAQCDYLDMRLSAIAPHDEADVVSRMWRRSEFSDPLTVGSCSVVLDEAIASFRDDFTSGDIRLYQSQSSTFTLYSGEGVAALALYERDPTDLTRAELELAE